MVDVLGDDSVTEFYRRAHAQFCDPKDGFRYWRFFQALDRLEGGNSILALEARVMLMLQLRKRPYLIRIHLAKLFELRMKRGEGEAFQGFEALLAAHVPKSVSDGVLAAHGSQLFADLPHGSIWAHLTKLIESLQRSVGEVFLNSGTLLGVVREGKFLDHDDDVDLAVFLDAESPEEAARRWSELRMTLFQSGLAKLEDQEMEGKFRSIKLPSSGGYEIDLFPAWVQDGRVYVYPHTYGDLLVSDVLPLRPCPVTQLPIPAKPEKMLAVNYGSGWREPNPYFVFPWSEAKQRFSPFLKRVGNRRFKRVLTYGTFDLFHVGHQRLLQRLSLLAEEVIVGCSTCEFNELKGKAAALPYEQRAEMLSACRYVTQVIPECEWGQKRKDVAEYDADLFVMGDDWLGEFDDLSDLCQVLYLPRTEGISTTKLKSDIIALPSA